MSCEPTQTPAKPGLCTVTWIFRSLFSGKKKKKSGMESEENNIITPAKMCQ